jgi:hypothetical protein
VINVQESREKAADWARESGFTFPVLLDPEGKTSARYAPTGVLPDLPREQVPIAANLISLLDSAHFDAKLKALSTRLEELFSEE